MSDTIPKLGMEHFFASSVHDMKNSISMLIGGLEKTVSQIDPNAFPAFANMANMIYETKRINNNLVQLLTLYKAGNHLYPFDPQTQDVAEFLRMTGDQNAPLLAFQKISLEIRADDELYWEFDEDLISGVIGNALNNAIRYTRDRIGLVAKQVDGFLELRVEDNGKGFPQQMIDEGIVAMQGTDFIGGSTGLGLHFSVMAAKMHRHQGKIGEIRLENGGAWGGGCFVLRLP